MSPCVQPVRRTGRAAAIVALLIAATVASAQEVGPEVPVFTRHSGVVKMQSWLKGFTTRGWVAAHHKTAYIGAGDWFQLSGSGAQADIVLPDLTTILMRKAAEMQILKLGGAEHEFRIFGGISYDVTLRSTPTRFNLPGDLAVRGRDADVLIQFQPTFGRLRVRHARGEPLEVLRAGKLIRALPAGQTFLVDVDTTRPEPVLGAEQDISKPFVFKKFDRRIEIPPGVVYRFEGRRVTFTRDAVYGKQFGIIRIGDEVIVVGPTSTVQASL